MGDFPYLDYLTQRYITCAKKSGEWTDYLKVSRDLIYITLIYSFTVPRLRITVDGAYSFYHNVDHPAPKLYTVRAKLQAARLLVHF